MNTNTIIYCDYYCSVYNRESLCLQTNRWYKGEDGFYSFCRALVFAGCSSSRRLGSANSPLRPHLSVSGVCAANTALALIRLCAVPGLPSLTPSLNDILKGIQSNYSMAFPNTLPSLCAVPCRGREADSLNPSRTLAGRTLFIISIVHILGIYYYIIQGGVQNLKILSRVILPRAGREGEDHGSRLERPRRVSVTRRPSKQCAAN